jgi:uncharacterized tellurite resistance protein B-like protein
MSDDWRNELASEQQKEKLRFFGCTWDDGITAGQAEDALADCARQFPEAEATWQKNQPATEKQKEKLKFFGCTWNGDITVGKASDALLQCASDFPAEEAAWQFQKKKWSKVVVSLERAKTITTPHIPGTFPVKAFDQLDELVSEEVTIQKAETVVSKPVADIRSYADKSQHVGEEFLPTREQLAEIRAFGKKPPKGLTFKDATTWIEQLKIFFAPKTGQLPPEPQTVERHDWRTAPASEKQKEKLRLLGCTFDDNITVEIAKLLIERHQNPQSAEPQITDFKREPEPFPEPPEHHDFNPRNDSPKETAADVTQPKARHEGFFGGESQPGTIAGQIVGKTAAATPVFIPPTPEQLDDIRSFGQTPPPGLTFQEATIWIDWFKSLYSVKPQNESPQEVTIQKASKPQNSSPSEYTIPARDVQNYAESSAGPSGKVGKATGREPKRPKYLSYPSEPRRQSFNSGLDYDYAYDNEKTNWLKAVKSIEVENGRLHDIYCAEIKRWYLKHGWNTDWEPQPFPKSPLEKLYAMYCPDCGGQIQVQMVMVGKKQECSLCHAEIVPVFFRQKTKQQINPPRVFERCERQSGEQITKPVDAICPLCGWSLAKCCCAVSERTLENDTVPPQQEATTPSYYSRVTPEQLDELRSLGENPTSALIYYGAAKIWIENCKAKKHPDLPQIQSPPGVTIQGAATQQNKNFGDYTIPARLDHVFAQRRPAIQKPTAYSYHAPVERFAEWVEGVIERNLTFPGGNWLPAGPLNYAFAENIFPTISFSRKMADTIESKGYCVEPDARFGSDTYDKDQTLALFKPLDGDPIQPSTAYLGAANLLRLCILITTADGKIDLVELDLFRQVIEKQVGLTLTDHKRLLVLEQLLAQELCSATKAAAKIAKSVPADKRLVIAHLLVQVAAANNEITRDERRALERIFKTFEIPLDTLEKYIYRICSSRAAKVHGDVSKNDKWLWNHWRTGHPGVVIDDDTLAGKTWNLTDWKALNARWRDLHERLVARQIQSPQKAIIHEAVNKQNLSSEENISAFVRSPQEPPDERIIIPEEAREQTISIFGISVRLRHIFEYKKFSKLGDIHDISYAEFGKFRNCGKTTVTELRELVRKIQSVPPIGHADGISQEYSAPFVARVGNRLVVPATVQDFKFCDLPVSVRLGNILETRKAIRLGDLNGVSISELMIIKNCGKTTISEIVNLIEESVDGEFKTITDTNVIWSPSDLASFLDKLISELSAREVEILDLRLSGDKNQKLTLEDVAAKFKLTRERIRQIIIKITAQLRKAGSLKLNAYLLHIGKVCRETFCPLTPELFEQWLGEKACLFRFSPSFYARLLCELNPVCCCANSEAKTEQVAGLAPRSFTLDEERVYEIIAETKEVIAILSVVMADEPEESIKLPTKITLPVPETLKISSDSKDAPQPTRFNGLDAAFHVILERLLTRDSWPVDDFDALAREFHFMPGKICETINEWSDEALGEFILDGDDPVVIRRELIVKETIYG